VTNSSTAGSRIDPAWVAIIPIGHLALSGIYLYFYAIGFGQGIDSILRTVDAIDVAFRSATVYYIGVLIGLFLSNPALHENALPPGGRWDSLSARYEPDVATKKLIWEQRLIRAGIVWMIAISIVIATLLFKHTGEVSWFLLTPMLIYTLFITYSRRSILDIKVADFIKVIHVIFSIIVFASFGYDEGRANRNGTLNTYENRVRCGEFFVIRSLSAGMLSMDMKGRRFIIDDQCNIVL
jgi:hypothetical protein